MTDLADVGVDDDVEVLDENAPSPATDDEHRSWRTRITVPRLVLTAIVVVYVAYFTQRSIDVHHALGTASYDSALYDQGVWLLSEFKAPFVTLMGRNMFGDHTSFILLGLVPIYWVWPSAGVLFLAQSAAIGAGAIPVFLYGRTRLGNEWFALIAAGTYLLHPAVGWTNLENFHPDAFLGVFVGFAIYAALESKWRMYATFVVLSLLVKEDASLVLVPLGIWVGIKRSWRIGVATVLGSVAFMLVAMFVVMRGLIGVPTRNSWRIPFGGPRGVIDTAITNPTELVDYFQQNERPWYLWQMTAPFAWLFLRLPSVAAISSLVLFTNVLSTFWYQHQIEYHYSLVAVPALSIGTVYAIGAIRERREVELDREDGTRVTLRLRGVAIGLLAVASLWTAYLWAPMPFGRTELFYGNPSNPWASSARQLIEQIPGDAVLSAHYRITPHTAHREEIYQFPTPFRSVLYGPDGNVDGPRIPERAERVEFVMLPTNTNDYPLADWLVIESAFELVDSNDHWILYERDFDRVLPPPIE